MIYNYGCKLCSYEWEIEQKINDSSLTQCPNCKQESAQRLILGAPSFILKGSGWAKDSYSKNEK